jgi:hypothetical protein
VGVVRIRYMGGPVPAEVEDALPHTRWMAGYSYAVPMDTGTWMCSRWPAIFKAVDVARHNTMHSVSEVK